MDRREIDERPRQLGTRHPIGMGHVMLLAEVICTQQARIDELERWLAASEARMKTPGPRAAGD